MQCAPLRSDRVGSCFDAKELEVLAKAWNHTKAGQSTPVVIPSPETQEEVRRLTLHANLQARFAKHCNKNEACWLDNTELNESLQQLAPEMYRAIHQSILRPKGMPGSHDWLSTTEIDNVMTQFEPLFPDFKYIGCFPSDFFRLNPREFPGEVVLRYPKSALVFNLDSSKQPGSHWVAVFFESHAGNLTIEYFDPTGKPPNRNIKQFLDTPPLDAAEYKESTYKHQKGDTECGVYSLYYIIERLMGRSFTDSSKHRITDEAVNRFRLFLFRPYSTEFSYGMNVEPPKAHRRFVSDDRVAIAAGGGRGAKRSKARRYKRNSNYR